MTSDKSPTGLSRRHFARTLLGGGAMAALTCAVAALPAAAAQASPATVSITDETQATVARVLAHYGSRMNAIQKARLPRLVSGHIAMLEPIRAMAQANSATPATVLRLVSGQ
ncbi:MAG: hypothetical protein ACRD0Y_01430 [Terriglobales bacterium]